MRQENLTVTAHVYKNFKFVSCKRAPSDYPILKFLVNSTTITITDPTFLFKTILQNKCSNSKKSNWVCCKEAHPDWEN